MKRPFVLCTNLIQSVASKYQTCETKMQSINLLVPQTKIV